MNVGPLILLIASVSVGNYLSIWPPWQSSFVFCTLQNLVIAWFFLSVPFLSVVCRDSALCSSSLPSFLPFYVFCTCMIAHPLQATVNMNFTLKRKKTNVCFSDDLKLVTHHFYSIICCCGSLRLSHSCLAAIDSESLWEGHENTPLDSCRSANFKSASINVKKKCWPAGYFLVQTATRY